MYAYWIQIELISLIIAFKFVRKYLLTPGKKGLCMQNYGQLLLVLGGTNVPFRVQSS